MSNAATAKLKCIPKRSYPFSYCAYYPLFTFFTSQLHNINLKKYKVTKIQLFLDRRVQFFFHHRYRFLLLGIGGQKYLDGKISWPLGHYNRLCRNPYYIWSTDSLPHLSFFIRGRNILFRISSGAYAFSVLHHQGHMPSCPYAVHASVSRAYIYNYQTNYKIKC